MSQQHNQNKYEQKQQHWYAHVASSATSTTTMLPSMSSLMASRNNAAAAAACMNMNMFAGTPYHSNNMSCSIDMNNAAGIGGLYDLEMRNDCNSVAYAQNQLQQFQHSSIHGITQQQQHHQQQQQHFLQHPMASISSAHYIKPEPLEHNQIDQNPIEVEELIIKTEPTEEHHLHHHQKSIFMDDSISFADYNNYSVHPSMLNPKIELSIKEENPAAMQQKQLNFPRRKVIQSERSDTLPICQRCKQVFFKKQIYMKHVAESACDILEYDFKCSICPMSFMSMEELQSHEQLHRENKFFCHKYCGKHFDTIQQCESHEYMQHEYDTFVCNICTATYPTRDLLFTHLPQHKYQQRFDCPICRLWYQTPHELHQHRLAAPFFCGKYYMMNQMAATSAPARSMFPALPPIPTTPPQEPKLPNYKLQDCHMAVMEVPPAHDFTTTSAATAANTATTSSFLNQRLTFQSQPPQQQQQQHQQQFNNGNNNYFQTPAIKTEIKVEPDFYPSAGNDYQQQQQQHLQHNYNEYTNDSFSSSHNSSSNYANDFGDIYNAQQQQQQQANASTLDESEDAVCCVPRCGVRKSSSPTLQFFTFPKDEKYLHQWLHNLKMFHVQQVTYLTYRICSLHFPKRCINRYSLCYWAVPTFNLGHDDVANLYQNRELTNTFTSGEVARCSMPQCASQRGESNLKFYNFPKDIKSLIKWCQNARLPVQGKEPRHFCSRHFEDRCIGKFRLKPWAVPTLHLGTPFGKIHDNPQNLYVEEKRCCLTFCRRSRSSDFNMSLYRFPRDEVLLRRWCYNLRLDPSVYRGKNHKICSGHFIKEALGLRKLSPGAVPTLNLGHMDTFNIYENELYTPPPPPPHKLYQRQQFHNITPTAMSSNNYASMLASLSPNQATTSPYANIASNSTSSTPNVTECMDVCCVPGCDSKRHSADDITFHTIPRRPEQMQKWCHNLKLEEDKIHKGLRVCSLHFETYCIGGCMRPFAVPTLNLGHDDPNIYKNPDVIKKLNIRETCCVRICKRNRERDHANLHRFPSNPLQLKKWCDNLHKPVPDGSRLFNDAICEVHFEDRCLRSKRLEKWAVPTLNLGHTDLVHLLPSEAEVAELYAKPSAPNNGDEEGECCVETCKRNPQIDDIKLYRTPEDPEVLAKWANNLQVDCEDLTCLRICNLHFESHCIGKRMHAWAIPTLNLGTNIENLYENPEFPVAIKKEKLSRFYGDHIPLTPSSKPTWVPRCCLSHCRKMRSVHHVQLFRFPSINRSMLAKWCHNLQVPLVGSAQRRICSAHFDPAVLSKKCPVPHSVPTLDLNTPPGYKIYQNPAKLKAVKFCMQRVCLLETCHKSRADGVQLFRFPHNISMLRKWLHNIRQKPKMGSMRLQYRLCSLHFETHSFLGKRLSPGAIPTLNLGYEDDDQDIYPNEAQSFVDETCIVEGCDALKEMPDVRLFKFPTDDEDLLWKWCNNLKMNPVDCHGVRICNRHFEVECIGASKLYKWAIPTRALGHDDANTELILNPLPDERYSEQIFKCCVPTCGKTRKYDEVQMNSFPKELKLFRRWKHNLKLEYLRFKEREKYKICIEHFEPICIGKARLNHGAIPTLNLGHNQTIGLYKVKAKNLQSSNLFGKNRPPLRMSFSSQSDLDENEEENLDQDIEEHSKCCYPNCSASKSLLSECFDLPTSPILFKLWSVYMKIDSSSLTNESKLCGIHFQAAYEATSMAAQVLSLLLNNSDNEHDNVTDSSVDLNTLTDAYARSCSSKVVRSAKCCIPGCKSSRLVLDTHKLYRLPSLRTELYKKWLHNAGLQINEEERNTYRICDLHFESKCFIKSSKTTVRFLHAWAIPTLELKNVEGRVLHQNIDSDDRLLELEAENRCCVPSCERSIIAYADANFHSLPDDEVMREKWLHNLQLDADEYEKENYKICELHFQQNCFDKTTSKLHEWAIPTIKISADDSSKDGLYQPSASGLTNKLNMTQVKMKKSLDLAKCCVPTCRKSRLEHGIRLFSFPTGPVHFKKWCHNLQIGAASILRKQQPRICNLHFHKRCIIGKQLRSWAMPTIQLGHTAAIYENPKNIPGFFLPVCALSHCRKRRSLSNDLRTFQFPKGELLEKWCTNLRLEPFECRGRICAEHFETSVMGKLKLKTGAVPTLNLGHDGDLIYDNSTINHNTSAEESYMHDANNDDEQNSQIYGDESFNDDNEDDDDDYADDYDNDNIQHEQEQYDNENNDMFNDDYNDPLAYVETCAADDGDDEYVTENRITHPPSNYANRNPKSVNNIAPICCLKHCRKEKTPQRHLSTFGFPKDRRLLLKWCSNLKLKPDECIGRVCIEHFDPEMLGSRKLKHGAIPTINVGHDEPLKYTQRTSDMESAEQSIKIENSGFNATDGSYYAEKLSHSVFRLFSLKHCRKRKADDEQSSIKFETSNICCVNACGRSSRGNTSVLLFKFPIRSEQLRKWCHNLQMNVYADYSRKYICNRHFETDCIQQQQLHEKAVPTILLGHKNNELVLYRNQLPFEDYTPLQYKVRRCCVRNCGKSREFDGVRFNHFPKNRVLQIKWAHNLQIEPSKNRLVCHTHFEPFCRPEQQLVVGAVPTLKLGHNDRIIYRNSRKLRQRDVDNGSSDGVTGLNHCLVPMCRWTESASSSSQTKFYKLPDTKELKDYWLQYFKIDITADNSACKSHACAIHLMQLYERVLSVKSFAEESLAKFLKPVYMSLQNLGWVKMRTCSVAGCQTKYMDNKSLMQLPRNEELCAKWLHNTNITYDWRQHYKYRICVSHFETLVMDAGRPMQLAVPTLKLPKAVEWIYENTSVLDEINGWDAAQFECQSPQSEHYQPEIQTDNKDSNLKMIALEQLLETANTKTRKQCCISNCSQQLQRRQQFFRFPKANEMLLQKWCVNTQQDINEAREKLFVCADHFQSQAFIARDLRPWAVPTINLGHDDVILENYKQSTNQEDEDMLYIRENYCAILTCFKKRSDQCTFYPYPSEDMSLIRKWAANCKHRAYQASSYKFQICQAHFAPDCFERNAVNQTLKLRDGAVPTIKLGYTTFGQQHIQHSEWFADTSEDQHCIVPLCVKDTSTSSSALQYYKLPKSLETLQQWCDNLKLDIADCVQRDQRICERHFELHCFTADLRLHKSALPTLHLGHSAPPSEIHQNPTTFERPESIPSCCVPKCGKTKLTDEIQLSGFPQKRCLHELWAHNLKLPLTTWLVQHGKVCSTHFEPDCYDRGRLRYGALPTLQLGHEDSDIHHTNMELIGKTNRKVLSKSNLSAFASSAQVVPKMELKCFYPDCTQIAKQCARRVYDLPTIEALRRHWLRSMGYDKTEEDSFINSDTHLKCCPVHFVICYQSNLVHLESMQKDAADEDKKQYEIAAQLLREDYNTIKQSTRFLKISCAVPSCQSLQIRDAVKLYQLPYNQTILEKWLFNTQIDVDESRRNYYKVCSLHFEPQCLLEVSKRLKLWAVPTLALPAQSSDAVRPIYQNPAVDETQRHAITNCCIPSCPNANLDEQTDNGDISNREQQFSFPRDANLMKKWLYNTQLKSRDTYSARICALHFEKHCIGKRLRNWAIPTLLLGHDLPDIYQNPSQHKRLLEIKREHTTVDSDDSHLTTFSDTKTETDLTVDSCFEMEGDVADGDDDAEPLEYNLYNVEAQIETTTSSGKAESTNDEHFESTQFRNSSNFGAASMDDVHIVDGDYYNRNRNRDEYDDHVDDNLNAAKELEVLLEVGHVEEYASYEPMPTTYHDHSSRPFIQQHQPQHSGRRTTGKNDEPPIANARYCCIEGCSSRIADEGIKLHKFPQGESILKQWKHNTQVDVDPLHSWRYRICSLHFEPECLNGHRFKTGTVPTLNLGPRRPQRIYNNRFDNFVLKPKKPNQETLKYSHDDDQNSYNDEYENDDDDDDYNQFDDYYKTPPSRQPWKNMTSTLNAYSHQIKREKVSHSYKSSQNYRTAGYNDTAGPMTPNFPKSKSLFNKWQHNAGIRNQIQNEKGSRTNDVQNFKSSQTCRIVGCKSHVDMPEVTMHKFPKSKTLFDKWQHNTGIIVDPNYSWRYRICNRHFDSSCFHAGGYRLLGGSVPTLFLPTNAPKKQYGNEFFENSLGKHLKCATPPSLYEEIDAEEYAGEDEYITPTLEPEVILGQNDDEDDDAVHIIESSQVETFMPNQKQLKMKQETAVGTVGVRDDVPIAATAFHCSIAGCKSHKRTPGVTLHKYPSPADHLRKWLHNTQVDVDLNYRWRYRICSLHFEPECFRGTRLNYGCVPTLNLGKNEPMLIYQNNENTIAAAPNNRQVTTSNDFSPAKTTNFNTPLNNVLRCSIASCGRICGQDGVSLHRLPQIAQTQHKWIYNARLQPDQIDGYHQPRVCSKHFEAHCYTGAPGKRYLKPGMFPTLNLGHNDPNVYTFENLSVKVESGNLVASSGGSIVYNEIKSGYGKCSLLHCQKQKSQHGIKIYKFPKSPKQQEKWTHNLRIQYDPQRPWKYLICSEHFEKECVSKRKLYKWAVPTLNLGTNVPKILFTNIDARLQYKAEHHTSDEDSDDQDDDDDDGIDATESAKEHDGSAKEHDGSASQEKQGALITLSNVIKQEKGTTQFNEKLHKLLTASTTNKWTDGRMARTKINYNKKSCCLPHCRSGRNAEVKLFRYPKNPKLIPQWEHNTGQPFGSRSRNTKLLCSQHFEPDLIGIRRLAKRAVPTLNLGPNAPKTLYKTVKLANSALDWDDEDDDDEPEPTALALEPQKKQTGDQAFEHGNLHVETMDMEEDLVNYNARVLSENLQLVYDDDSEIVDGSKEDDSYNNDWTTTTNTTNPALLRDLPGKRLAYRQRHCCVPHCGIERTGSLKLFRVPTEPELIAKWEHNLRMKFNMRERNLNLVCSLHFEAAYIGVMRLVRGTVPTLNLGHNSEQIYRNRKKLAEDGDNAVASPTSMEMELLKCAVPSCRNTWNPGGMNKIQFFNFPKVIQTYRRWCRLLQIDDYYKETTWQTRKICSAHFQAHSYEGNVLRSNALPILNLKAAVAQIKTTSIVSKSTIDHFKSYILDQQQRKHCIIRNCQRVSSLYDFPENRNLCAKWCHNLKIPQKPKLHNEESYSICRKHFEPGCLHQGKLHPEAVPTLDLGHTDANIFQNTTKFSTSTKTNVRPDATTHQSKYDDNNSLHTNNGTLAASGGGVDAVGSTARSMPFTTMFNGSMGATIKEEPIAYDEATASMAFDSTIQTADYDDDDDDNDDDQLLFGNT